MRGNRFTRHRPRAERGRSLEAASSVLLVSLAFGLLAAGCGRASGGRAETGDPPPVCPGCNVVLVSIDTLRADHLGLYGYDRPTSPNIDAWAKKSIVFDQCFSQAPSTLLSHMSLFTGLYPSHHGVLSNEDRLPDETKTFVDVLHSNGYTTAAFTGGGFLREKFNYHTFDLFKHSDFWDVRLSEHHQFREMLAWIAQQKSKFFLFWHTYKVHSPYTPWPKFDRFSDPGYHGIVDTNPAENDPLCTGLHKRQCNWRAEAYFDRIVDKLGPADLELIQAKYDGEILEVDLMFSRLLYALKRAGLDDKTVVIFLSDHGETFDERPASRIVGHGVLYREVLHVPLILSVPGAKPERLSRVVEMMDIGPNLLDLVGLAPPKGIDARNLFAPAKLSVARAESPLRGLSSVITSRFELIRKELDGATKLKLYDLTADPGELRNLVGTGNPAERSLFPLLPIAAPVNRSSSNVALDPDIRRELESLGYL